MFLTMDFFMTMTVVMMTTMKRLFFTNLKNDTHTHMHPLNDH